MGAGISPAGCSRQWERQWHWCTPFSVAPTDEDEGDSDDADASSFPGTSARTRRTPQEADALRARMVREGYPLPGVTSRENNRIWVTLTQRRRWNELLRLVGMTDEALQARIKDISRQHLAETGRK